MITSSSVRMTRTWAWRVLADATREDKCVQPTEMAQYHPSLRSLDARNASEFFGEKRIGQAVKTVALGALRREAPGNGQDFGYPRHIAVKGRVEASTKGFSFVTR